MSGSTRAPGAPGPGDGTSEPTEPGPDYVERLGDRLGSDGGPPLPSRPQPLGGKPGLGGVKRASARGSAPAPPASFAPSSPAEAPSTLPPPPGLDGRSGETSDVRPSPPDRDEAISVPPMPPDPPAEAFAEFEGDSDEELAAESTAIDDREALASESTQIIKETPAMPLLVVEAGKDRGREFVIVEGETTVGRGIDNEVILADVSVSRRHLRIVREGDVITMRDLGSGNGTLVNGRRVHGATLVDGDRIELGETVLVVRVPGADPARLAGVPEAAPALESTTDETPSPGSAGMSIEPSVLQSGGSPWSLPPAAGPTPGTPAADWTAERTGTVVLDRRTLIVAGIGIAVGASILGALVVAIVVRTSQSSTATVAGPPVVVVPPAPPPSVAAAPVTPPPGVAPPIGEVSAATTPVPAAPAAPTPPVPDLAPSPAAGPAPLAPAEPAGPRASSAVAAVDHADDEGRPAERPRAGRTPPLREARSAPARGDRAPVSGGADAILAPYRAGDFAAAARAARAAGNGALANQIDQFATHYRNAQSAARGSPAAIAAMERALALDQQIVRGGHYASRIRPGLVAAYLDGAQAAMSARPQEACRRVQQAIRLDGSNSRAQQMGRQCETQAQRLLGEAAAAERTDPQRARGMYQAILPMVPQSSAAYTRARQRIDALARSRPVDEDE